MIISINPDKEKVKSMLKMVENREMFLKSAKNEKFPNSVTENYYEVIKELAASVLLLDGLKTSGEKAHKEMIDSLANYKEISQEEIEIMDDLRIKRNKSMYEGKEISTNYLESKKNKLQKIIEKLKTIINTKLRGEDND